LEKGTKKRKRKDFDIFVENMGGQLNAYTSREITSYTITVQKKDFPSTLEVIGDMLQNSLYSQEAIERERETIYREVIETQREEYEAFVESSH